MTRNHRPHRLRRKARLYTEKADQHWDAEDYYTQKAAEHAGKARHYDELAARYKALAEEETPEAMARRIEASSDRTANQRVAEGDI